jgi:hypothetical protein
MVAFDPQKMPNDESQIIGYRAREMKGCERKDDQPT